MRWLLGFLAPILLILLPISLVAESNFVLQYLEPDPSRNTYQLQSYPIINRSESVRADTLNLLNGVDYLLDYKTGVFTLLRPPQTSILAIEYILIPKSLREPISTYQVKEVSDSLFASIKKTRIPWLAEDGNLAISGSKTFAISFSDDDAFDLKQSLYVNLSGELSTNVNISAQLSDSQSKLTPEGDSKELSSLDRVFIRVFGRQYEIAMGDLDWEFKDTRFINYLSKFEGINAYYRDRHFAQAGYSASGGKSAFSQIVIIDGKQGPYYLNPTGLQTTYLIIAGSEQIYLDGRLLERGMDYYIDYTEGSVMFRALVTSSNLVNAYYQFSDEYYKQSMYFNSSRIGISKGLSLSHHIIHQVDAKNAPLLYEFSAADLDSLSAAGDSQVWGNGAIQVAAGEGTYFQRISTTGTVYYEYAAADTTADYIVYFAYVGGGNGDYEEFSSGKYRYVGSQLGSWVIGKRLIPPVKRSNLDLRLDWGNESLSLGVEGLYSANDKNTFSTIDDGDNRSGIMHAFGRYRGLKLDYEKRWDASYLFSQYYDPSAEYDFAAVETADSLAQSQYSLAFAPRVGESWKPELMLRYKDIPALYSQKALRLLSQSPSQRFLPALGLRSTLAQITYSDSLRSDAFMQFHELTGGWDRSWWKAKLMFNYNSLEYDDASILYSGNRYLKFSPNLTVGNPRISTSNLGFSLDQTELQTDGWQRLSQSQTYILKHNTTLANHNLNLDYTHRSIKKTGDNPRSDYDLINLRNNHSFLKQALMLAGFYQLNQTEFYPKIRELEYVGDGLGVYDSTGVYTPQGDYDYVYITSDIGSLSSEINAQLSCFLKPGNLFARLNRVHSDIIVTAAEQSGQKQDWRRYLFLPGSVYNADTIYGKQSYNQDLWLDIAKGKVVAELSLELDRSLDNRYQEQNRTYGVIKAAQLDIKQSGPNNYNLGCEHRLETDSRYRSEIVSQSLKALWQRNLSPYSILTMEALAASEKGESQNGSDDYTLSSLGLSTGFRGTWSKLGRASGSFGVKYNDREGTDFLAFLPEKRAGWLFNWTLSAIYRLNSFSSASLEYNGNSYPEQDMKHQLKLEFKAEL